MFHVDRILYQFMESHNERLTLPRPLADAIEDHRRRWHPLECCGLLGGLRRGPLWSATTWYPMTNAIASPTRFESVPSEMFAVQKALRAAGEDLLAVVHSHPTSAAVPSALDRSRSLGPIVLALILGTDAWRAWVLEGNREVVLVFNEPAGWS
ncbi:MAG: M67 family metallopeptidase [Gemmataceae bacterium]